jgi:hypothetical protein
MQTGIEQEPIDKVYLWNGKGDCQADDKEQDASKGGTPMTDHVLAHATFPRDRVVQRVNGSGSPGRGGLVGLL